jgi:S-disulfanyl-L-cysteine oxidoreductase SoxD
MYKSTKGLVLIVLLLGATVASAQGRFQGVGRAATPAEIKAWDIDVRSDFKGLPKGAGSVAKGQQVWDAQCASCHGVFGESNEVFTPIVGGTTKEDIKVGRVSALKRADEARTTLMKLSSIATLWDYINRAMPWTTPKSLTVEEVYAVTAYILHLGEIVPESFVLSDQNVAEVQRRLPNRNGMTQAHGLGSVTGVPDVKNVACMKNCPVEAKDISTIPDHARNVHGDLIEQHRIIGPVRGALTSQPAPVGKVGEQSERLRVTAMQTVVKGSPVPADGMALAKRHACVACHAMDQKSVGPSVKEIAGKYRLKDGSEPNLIAKVKAGGAGAWGDIPMPPQAHISDDELKILVHWMLTGPR